jgi:glycosyltransferase involved in cell wall biosynthesis
MLLDWMKYGRDKGLDLNIIVRGAYAPGDTEYPAKILKQIADQGLTEHVKLDGFVEDRAKLYSDIDLVCVPSINPEPLARSIMEGMSRALPVVATPTGGTEDMLVDGKTGYVCRDADRFVEIVTPLMADRSQLAKLGLAGRDVIIAKFGMDRLHREISEVYARCGVRF